tara:strand:+ start:1316 stop:2476 length:1161 start_codon:yes stop_codon:yes gene_type:complete
MLLKISIKLLFLFSITQVAKRTIYSESLEWSPWAYTDYLISFPGKYIRRGLLGEFLILIDKDNFLFDTIQKFVFVNFLIFCILLYLFLNKFKVELSHQFILLFSSFGVFHMSTYNFFYFRKEILVFNFFMIFQFLLRYFNNDKIKYFLSSMFLLVVFLIHEGILILIFPFVLLNLSRNVDEVLNIKKLRYFYFFLVTLSIIFKGTYSDSRIIWEKISDLDKLVLRIPPTEFDNLYGAVSAIGWTISEAFMLSFNTIFSGNLIYWIAALFLALLPIYFCFFYNIKKLDHIKKKLFIYRFDFLPIVFIFLAGWDWGRWINILYYFTIFTLISFSEEQSKPSNNLNFSHLIFIFTISFFSIVPDCCINGQAPKILDNLSRIFTSINSLF